LANKPALESSTYTQSGGAEALGFFSAQADVNTISDQATAVIFDGSS
jgi:hypothetical protein